jgi:hypothetical protein
VVYIERSLGQRRWPEQSQCRHEGSGRPVTAVERSECVLCSTDDARQGGVVVACCKARRGEMREWPCGGVMRQLCDRGGRLPACRLLLRVHAAALRERNIAGMNACGG